MADRPDNAQKWAAIAQKLADLKTLHVKTLARLEARALRDGFVAN